MSRILSETRSFRNNLNTHLTNSGWSDLNYSEGWEEINIENPLLNVYIFDGAKASIELGYQFDSHKLFERILQIDCYMESEDRVRTLCEDVMDYLDSVSLDIVDIQTTSGIGYAVFPDSETITANFLPPSFNNPEILRWRGVVRGQFEAYYPNGGNPL